jgi:hypothetical protein
VRRNKISPLQLGEVASQCIANLYRAGNWSIRRCRKDQRHSVAGRQARQFAISIGCVERIGSPNNFIERMQVIALLIDQELGVTDDVDEEDVGDLQPDLFFDFGGHSGSDLKLREPNYLLVLWVSRANG